MNIRRGEVYLADLNPRFGTEPGKRRPVLIVQTNLLNDNHPSTIICPLSTRLVDGSTRLRFRVAAKSAGLERESEVLIDQIRAVDNRRLIKRLGHLSAADMHRIGHNLADLLDLGADVA